MFPVARHRLPQLAADAALVALAWILAFKLRFDQLRIPPYYQDYLAFGTITLVVGLKLVFFSLFGFYNRWWRYVSTRDMWGAARGVTAASVATYLVFYFVPIYDLRVPRAVAVTDWLLLLAFVAMSRMLARTLIERPGPGTLVARGKEVIVVGAGNAAELMVREMLKSPALGYTPIGLVDDDPRKRKMRLHNIRVLGTTEDLPHILRDQKPDEILIAIPSAPGAVRQRVVEAAQAAKVPVKTLPGLHELIAGDVDLAGQIRPVQVEDILGREQVEVDLEEVARYVRGETVLVTGAGGSIGSEICRQLSRLDPARIVMVDIAESPLYEIERELIEGRGFEPVLPVLADVRDRRRLGQVFERYQPNVVFHAAAYKHVPLMEQNPVESVRTNVMATRVVAELAAEHGSAVFVLISTDKALNPRAVYGQCKMLCEWIVEGLGSRRDIATRFVAVRFGNVLNSAGSIVPKFRREIERGGPLKVTHPEMTRYFMTIPEAVSLVVQAGAIGGRGQVFVLDMGDPVKILDLAHTMIRLSGREGEIGIEYIGVRPGEKLHEELWGADEVVEQTTHPKIMSVTHAGVDQRWLEEQLTELERLALDGDATPLVEKLAEIVREPLRPGARAADPAPVE
jgi:FlaA1/EpsC-like NDP-sugar epimerase